MCLGELHIEIESIRAQMMTQLEIKHSIVQTRKTNISEYVSNKKILQIAHQLGLLANLLNMMNLIPENNLACTFIVVLTMRW